MRPEAPNTATWDAVITRRDIPPRVNQAVFETVMDITEPGSNILEVGPGEGACANALFENGRNVTLADFAMGPLRVATGYDASARTHLKPVQSDGRALALASDGFDAVYSQGLVEHFPDPSQVLEEMVRVARPGGKVLVDVPQTWSLQHPYKLACMRIGVWPFGWETSFSRKALMEAMEKAGLTIEDEYSYSWGIIPPIPQTARSGIGKMDQSANRLSDDTMNAIQALRLANTRRVKNKIGQQLLNCIGLVGVK